jgi:hypothetical protein
VDTITARGGQARILGGVAVELRATPRPESLQRPVEDVDVICRRVDRRIAEASLGDVGLVPDREINLAHGSSRQVWWTADRRLHLDLFLGSFRMCHTLELEERLNEPEDGPALGIGDLLLTKLQIVRLTGKDVRDLGALLSTNEPDGERIADACAGDWGLFTTIDDNLAALPGLVRAIDPDDAEVVQSRAERLRGDIAAVPKTRGWRMRARLGRKVRWYEEPEEVIDED